MRPSVSLRLTTLRIRSPVGDVCFKSACVARERGRKIGSSDLLTIVPFFESYSYVDLLSCSRDFVRLLVCYQALKIEFDGTVVQ